MNSNWRGNWRSLIAITIIVAIIIIIITPDSAIAVVTVTALLAFLIALGAQQGADDEHSKAKSGESAVVKPPQTSARRRAHRDRDPPARLLQKIWAPPRARTPPPPMYDTSSAFQDWEYAADPSAVYEAEALDVVGGGREFREGFEPPSYAVATRRNWSSGPDADTIAESEALDVVGGGDGQEYSRPTCTRRGCSAASAEKLDVAFGPPDPDWDSLAARAEAEGISLAQGGGGPGGPGAYVRGAPFTIPGYRPNGVTASIDGFREAPARRSGFTPLPGGHNPHAVFASFSSADGPWPDSETGGSPAPWGKAIVPRGTPHGTKYPGAIEADSRDIDTPGAWFQGHRDRNASQNHIIEGNPFDVSRIASPQAAGSCEDDEANDYEADLDESNVNQVRSRNDATRVEAGIFNRRKWLDPFLREELEQEEMEWGPWWGRNEL